MVLLSYRGNKSFLLEEIQYTESHKTQMYFFKDVDYIKIDDFQGSDLTLAEGEKANGYKILSNSPKVVNQENEKKQIAVIDRIMEDQYYNNWSRVVGDIISNYQGISSITSQIGSSERDKKNFLIESVQYMGESLESLQKKKEALNNLGNGASRNLTLNELKMLSSGYVYTSITPVEKIVSENMLPYINNSFLKSVSKIDQEKETVLKVINNDHVYAAFSIPEGTNIMGEEEVLSLKEEMMGTSDQGVNQAYYDFLVKRIDQLYYYPELRFEYNNKVYTSFFVDIIKEGNQKIMVLMIKDFVNDFSNVVVGETAIYIQDYKAFEIPKSAVFEKDEVHYIETMTKGYFSEATAVVVEKYNNKNAVLRSKDNPDLKTGTRVRTYP